MNPILYDYNETSFATQGIGVLSDAISCNVINQINSTYELELIYPITGKYFEEIKIGRLILAKHDESTETEPFEVYAISAPMSGKVIINAWHISYRLTGIVARPFSGTSLANALVRFKQAAMATCPFTFSTNKSVSTPFSLSVPAPMRSVMGGMEGSLLQKYHGEWEFKKWACTLKNRIGQDTDIVIKYGKNLKDAKRKDDMSNLWTGIVPYYSGEDGTVYYDGVIYSQYAESASREMTIAVDCTDAFDTVPTQQALQEWGENYVYANAKTGIPSSITISFVQLWQTKEYEQYTSLQRLFLGDSVTVYYSELGIDVTARIVKTDYDVLNERYDKMTVGSVQSNIAQEMKETVNEAVSGVPTRDWFNARLVEATTKITGGLGGYVVLNRNANGEPQEILIMDTADINTAVNVIRMNKNGIGFSQNGYDPESFNSAWTIDGTLDMAQINVLNLSATQMTTGIIQDATGTNYWNLDTGEISIQATAVDVGIGARNYIRHSNTLDFDQYYFFFSFNFNSDQALLNGENMEVTIT